MSDIQFAREGLPLPPVARRLRMDRFRTLQASFNPDQLRHEHEARAQVARKVRVCLRSMEPVVVIAPRWSQPMSFLEELAIDLISGRPALDCRTVRFRPIKGRALPEVWNHIVDVFARLTADNQEPVVPSSVVDRRGFRWSLRRMLDEAHQTAPQPVALLACEAEHLPLSALEDMVEVWEEYASSHPLDRRCVLLLAGSVQVHWLTITGATRVELRDYSEREAAATMAARADRGTARQLSSIARFTGGIPGLVDRFSAHYAEHGELPGSRDGLIQILGTLGDEMRGAVDIIAADDALSSRLEDLMGGKSLPEVESVDEPLRNAGLLQTVPLPSRQVKLRAPAIAALLG